METHYILSSIFLSDYLIFVFLLVSATRGVCETRSRTEASTNSHPRPAWKPA
jgi:hypothetical protein